MTAAWFEAPAVDGVGRIVLDRPDDEVNALDLELIAALSEAVREARACGDLRGLVVGSAKTDHWVAGVDPRILTSAACAAEIEHASRRFQAVCDELAWLPCTTVAALNGTALGGGFELALACDYRVALDGASVSVGQPEVNLGLVPAGGATQRLPRLVGLPGALDLILSGRRLGARHARRAGLVDEVVHPTALEQAARAWARKPKRPLDRPLRLGLHVQAALDLAEQTPAGRALMYRRARAGIQARTGGQYLAPVRALEAIQAGLDNGMAAGLDAEARAFGELAVGETARHLTWLFLATERQKRCALEGLPQCAGVERLGVVGAGFMGAAIAEVGVASGLTVRHRDVQSDYSGFAQVDLVIEAVSEDLAIKHQVIRELEQTVAPETVIASNTSALPISEIARAATRPERIVGMHFFSPAEGMPLLEVVQPEGAADWAVAAAVTAGIKMGKTVIVVRDRPGLYTSRVLGVMMNEATVLLREGARVADVERGMTAFGFKLPAAIGRERVPNPAAYRLSDASAERRFDVQTIQDRLVLLFVNEAIRCLEEHVLRSPTDGDLGAVLGLGFPPYRGGPFHYADILGLSTLEERLRRLADQHGSRYAPATLLTERARAGGAFFTE